MIDAVLIAMDALVQTRRSTYGNRPKKCRSRRNGDAAKPSVGSHLTADSLTIYRRAQPLSSPARRHNKYQVSFLQNEHRGGGTEHQKGGNANDYPRQNGTRLVGHQLAIARHV